MDSEPIILGIESSCDDTSASILKGRKVLSNVISNQEIHSLYGGVVPELASRAHEQNIIPVVDAALRKACVNKNEISAVAYTNGPGLLGSLLVGSSFAKSFSLGLGIPIITVNHMKGHILSHFIDEGNESPSFPFLCLTVSGGHTQIVKVESPTNNEPNKPGPLVKATADISFLLTQAFLKAASTTGIIFCSCALDASSGTTPPYKE